MFLTFKYICNERDVYLSMSIFRRGIGQIIDESLTGLIYVLILILLSLI